MKTFRFFWSQTFVGDVKALTKEEATQKWFEGEYKDISDSFNLAVETPNDIFHFIEEVTENSEEK